MIIFTHIPKTAGTTFHTIAESSYNNNLCKKDIRKMSYKMGDKISFTPSYVGGHLPYGLHRLFPDSNFKYVTFLRNPVDRYISCFNHVHKKVFSRKRGSILLEEIYKENDLHISVEKFNNYMSCDNSMTKFLSGYFDYERSFYNLSNCIRIIKNNSKKCRINIFVNLECDDKFESNGDFWLNKAKENLKKYYFVGFQEAFRKDVKFFFDKENMFFDKNMLDQRHKKTDNYFKSKLKDKSVYSFIENINKWDIMLYNFCLKEYNYGK